MADDDFKYSKTLNEVMEADEQAKQALQPATPPKKKKGLLGILSDTFIGQKVRPKKEYEDL